MGIDKTNYLNTLDTLTDALGMSEGQSIEEIKEELRSDGIDVDGAMGRLKMAQNSISKAAKRTTLDTARKKRLKLVEGGHEFIGRFKDWTKEQIMDRIKEIGGPEAGLAYRSLETMGTEEIALILEDLEMTNARTREEDDNGK
jgi:biotin operon repressor